MQLHQSTVIQSKLIIRSICSQAVYAKKDGRNMQILIPLQLNNRQST